MQPGAPTPAPTAATGESTGTLRIRLLGGLRVGRDDREIADADWRLSKARSIVKLIALAPSYQLHREYLIDLLWADLAPAAADNNFHQALHSARRALATVLDDRPASQVLILRRGILTVHPDIPIWVDVDAFSERSQVAIAGNDPQRYYEAIDIYGGELLPEDRYEEWAGPRRESLQLQFIDLLLRLGRLHAQRNELAPAIDAFRRVVELDLTCEEAHAGLMRLYALTNRRQQALRQFERLRDTLADELDTEPAATTQRLYLDILDNRFPAATIVEPAPEPPPAPPVTSRTRAFVNRITEMQRLMSFLDRALTGEGQVVVLGGEPGMGKTRLAEEFEANARQRGATVLWGRCYEGEGTPAFWPWSQLLDGWIRGHDTATITSLMSAGASDIARILPNLRDHLPDLPEPPPVNADAERFRLFSSVTAFLRNAAGRQPLVLILDDLQWADRSSLLLLEFVLNELRDSRVIIVGTYRDTEIYQGHPLQQVLERLNRLDDDRRIDMTGFPADDVATMAEVTSGQAPSTDLAAAIHQQTEGNPFFIREIVRLLVEEGRYGEHAPHQSWKISVPRGVRETIGLRLDRLSDDALRLLTVAAVAGREFELAVVAQAADTSIDRAIDLFDEALSAAIVDEIDNRPDRLRFAHILIRVTLYEEASHARRFRLHRRVGEAIEEFHASDLSPWIADLAGHFIACAADGDATKGVRYAIEAGQQAMEQVAYGEAVNYFLQAVELVGDDANRGDGNEQYVELLLLLANALRCDGETQQARETYSRAAMIASDAGQADLLARAALGIADTEGEASVDDDTSIRYLEQALALLPDSASVLRASALACLSMVLQYHGPDTMPRRGELARRAVELARHAGDPATLATALRAQLMAEWDPLDLTTSLKITEEILQLAREAGAGGLALIMHSQRFSHFMELGDVASADRELEAYATLAEELRLPYNRWSVTLKQSMRALMEGRFDDGQRLAYEAYQIGERSAPNSAHPLYVVQQFPLYRERGGLETIEADLRRYAEEDYISVTFERCLIAMIYCEMGRDDDARSELARIAQGRFGEIPVNIFWLGVTALLAEISAHLGETERCRDLYHQLMPFSGRLANSGTGVISIGPVSYFLGILATALGNLDDAEQHLHQAIELSERINAAPFAIRARLALADVLATRGAPADQGRLSDLLEQCQASARQLGMTRLYEHANSRLLSRR